LQECAEQVFTRPDDDADTVEPDTEFRYGGVQWTVAGAVAEVASGRTWAQLVDETIATPCGLDSLGYTDFQSEFDGDPANLPPTENPNPEAGAYIDAPDYAQVLLMQLRGGMCGDEQVLSPEAVEAMLANRIGEVYGGDTSGPATGPDKGGYGMGWWLDANNGRRFAYGAFGAVPMLDPDNGFGVYFVTEAGMQNGQSLASQIFDPIEAAVLAAR
jgi:CubicO group peptidase (beta-lactamase class C family)